MAKSTVTAAELERGDESSRSGTGSGESNGSGDVSGTVSGADTGETESIADNFVRKYGDINFQYIDRPREAVWFIRPHALNYFKDGVLYRTKGERTSAKTELFLDLMYVGIIANLAGEASEHASGLSLLKYFLFFMPAWTVWADIKDFTNYYYNEDLSQKVYILWILVLLTLYANSHSEVLNGVHGAALTIVPYILCRLSLAALNVVYSFYIVEHRFQQRLYAGFIVFTCALWIVVIFVGTRAKIGVAIAIIVLEQVFFAAAFHPITKRLAKLTTSTALNIEHEVERFSAFVTIAIGEFLYKTVAENPLGPGFSYKFARGVLLLIVAYILFWLYTYGSTAKKAVHPLRFSATTAITWIFAHVPLIGSIVLAADAGGELLTRESAYAEEELEPDLYALSLFFTGGICVAMCSIALLALIEVSRDEPGLHLVSKFWRVVWRIPIGIIILCLSFAKMDVTLMMGITALLLFVDLVYESVTAVPRVCLPWHQ